jgi:hypothetical protein
MTCVVPITELAEHLGTTVKRIREVAPRLGGLSYTAELKDCVPIWEVPAYRRAVQR